MSRINLPIRMTLRISLSVGWLALLVSCSPTPRFWTEEEVSILRSLSLASLPTPKAPSNRVANHPDAVRLGEALFFDTRLSGDGTQSCASCHQPQKYFTDGLPTGQGIRTLSRNTPTLIGGAWQHWFYWDGRRDSLWSQALIPIEAPDEMGGSRTAAVNLIAQDPDYIDTYAAVFGPLPPVLRAGRLPPHAGEFADQAGQNAWFRMPARTRQAVNSAYANVGKALAAYERTLTPRPAPFDRYVDTLIQDGEDAAAPLLSEAARRGAKLFIDFEASRCLQCHSGPLLTNGDFHNIGTGAIEGTAHAASARGEVLDFGRLFGVQAVLLDQFNCLGPHSDADANECSALRFLSRDQHGDMAGAFKTPTLRNVAHTAPYFHHGRAESLDAVLAHYSAPPDDNELVTLNLSAAQRTDLVAFLESLSSPAYSNPQAQPSATPTSTRFTASEKTLLATLSLTSLGEAPNDPGNDVFNSAAAAALGQALFHDARLSATQTVACATCHQSPLGLADGQATATGLAPLTRNTPGLVGVAWRQHYYWDGRKDSLWSQALEPIEAPGEMGGNRYDAVRLVANDSALATLYANAFEPLPETFVRALNDNALSPSQESRLNRTFVRLGKALAAHQRRFVFTPTRFDVWVDDLLSDAPQHSNLLTHTEIAGLKRFISADTQCVSCHNGPRFTNGQFHNIGTGTNANGRHDTGRLAGIEALLNDPFNCASEYGEADAVCRHLDDARAAEVPRLLDGAFRTPGLRGLRTTAPYMHDGRFDTLTDVLVYYSDPADKRTTWHELVPIESLDERAIKELVAFLNVLSDDTSAR
ncbi:MAG: cytochrome c peroxidase [Pseudomonadota bacterium]